MNPPRKLITFDWAIKRLLRSKANFGILEGFLSELLKEDIHIEEILESDSNQEYRTDKFNRVDMKVRNSRDELIIIEIQYDREYDYLQRIFYSASKAALEHLDVHDSYAKIAKVISINILYFDLGSGKDYIYHGSTRFIGLHNQDELQLSDKQKKLFKKETVPSLYPEYYLLKINKFDDIARDTLDEWIYFLKHEEVKPGFTAKGLKEAEDKLNILKLPDEERQVYERYLDNLHYQASMFDSSFVDGFSEGKKEGKKEGKQEGIQEGRTEANREMALKLIEQGVSPAIIAEVCGYNVTDITRLSQSRD
jgi:predicted transposase/invertase (TIGR01784 family)